MVKFNISMRDWIAETILSSSKGNRSARIEELIMKGLLYEKDQIYNQEISNLKNGLLRTTSDNLAIL